MLEDAIQKAIIDKFFEPTPLVQTQMVYDNTGSQRMESSVALVDSPATRVAQEVWKANQSAITQAVMERLDLAAIVEQCSEKITAEVVKHLTAVPNSWSSNPTPAARKQMMDKVYDQVAEEFGKQCVAHLRETGGLMGILTSAEEIS